MVYLERFTSDLYLAKRSDVWHYGALFDHLRSRGPEPGAHPHLHHPRRPRAAGHRIAVRPA